MATAEKTEEQKLEEAKKAADQRQLDARNQLARDVGKQPDSNPTFGVLDIIRNAFTDKDTGGPDWLKVIITALTAIAGSVFGLDLGAGGLLIGGLVGAAVGGLAGNFLLPFIRNEDPNKKPESQPVFRPDAPDANTKVVANAAITLPTVAALHFAKTNINVPFYDQTQNPAAKDTRENIEKLRKVLADGNQYDNPANSQARAFMTEVERSADSNEMNLRYLRDTMIKETQQSSAKIDEYLNKLSPEAKAALSVKLNVNIADIPGQYAKLPDGLEEYGNLIKASLLKEVADRHSTTPEGLGLESKQTIDAAWENLNVVAKRNLISNFAAQAKKDALDNKIPDARVIFPEYETTVAGVPFNPHDFNIFENNLEKQYKDALARKDFKTMADVLQQRLDADSGMAPGNRLSDDIKNKMKAFILGFKAEDKVHELDAYIQNTVEAHDLPKLAQFEEALKERNVRVATLQNRMQAFEQSGGKYLILDEPPAQNSANTINIKLLDTKSAQPKTVNVDITLENGTNKIQSIKVDGADRTSALKDKTLPLDDVGRTKLVQNVIEPPSAISSLSQTAIQQVEGTRVNSSILAYQDTGTALPAASSTPFVRKPQSPQKPTTQNTV